MSIEDVYKYWKKNINEPDLLKELIKIKDNPNEKYDRFYKSLEFGTAGLRGLMGAGTNRINIYTIRKTTQGFASYLLERYKSPSIAISYDSRNKSKLFAYTSAEVMAANGIKVYLTCEIQPTPFLSFAVRYLKCSAGIMITASHNPSKYNGYKCYDKDGAQITEVCAKDIYSKISEIDVFKDVRYIRIQDGLRNGMISFMENTVLESYVNNVMMQRINNNDLSNLSIVYTPLNGCGYKLVPRVLKLSRLKTITVVPEQKYPNGNFPTCKYPNPENFESFKLALEYAYKIKADIVIATDPDADRLGACVRYKGTYKFLSGNQLGIIMFYYIIKKKKAFLDYSQKHFVIKTIVSTKMINAIAKKENYNVIEVPTGFKNIAKEIAVLESNGEISKFAFAFEESNGYLCGTYTRDKDAISGTLLLCEATAYFKRNNLNLIDVLKIISEKYGYYEERTVSFEFKGAEGKKKINTLMNYFKNSLPKDLSGFEILQSKNYNSLYKTAGDIISLDMGNENEIIIRPSGTEPKLKVYIMVHENNPENISYKLAKLESAIKELVLKITESNSF